MLLPEDYPAKPPKMQLVTTGNGSVRFNANLYANGKVCLSLLGTWQGPGWDPSRSTLLQVFQSIPWNIMIGEPVAGACWFNEPGYNTGSNNPAVVRAGKLCAEEYDKQIRRCTMVHAMDRIIASPPAVFADIIHRHFTVKRASLKALVAKWAARELGEAAAAELEEKGQLQQQQQPPGAQLAALLQSRLAACTTLSEVTPLR